MKTDKNLFLYLLTHCTLAIDHCLSALNSIAQPHLLLKNKQAAQGHPQLMPEYNSRLRISACIQVQFSKVL